jgi:hypothetical protein
MTELNTLTGGLPFKPSPLCLGSADIAWTPLTLQLFSNSGCAVTILNVIEATVKKLFPNMDQSFRTGLYREFSIRILESSVYSAATYDRVHAVFKAIEPSVEDNETTPTVSELKDCGTRGLPGRVGWQWSDADSCQISNFQHGSKEIIARHDGLFVIRLCVLYSTAQKTV